MRIVSLRVDTYLHGLQENSVKAWSAPARAPDRPVDNVSLRNALNVDEDS